MALVGDNSLLHSLYCISAFSGEVEGCLYSFFVKLYSFFVIVELRIIMEFVIFGRLALNKKTNRKDWCHVQLEKGL